MIHTRVFWLWLVVGMCLECTTGLLLQGGPQPLRGLVKSLTCTMARNLDMGALVTPHGYPLESHEVVTQDGYRLTVFRIPRGTSDDPPKQAKKQVVYLQHGLLDSSAAWVINGPEQSLAFILADAGFDVWLGNSRGNSFGRGHTTLDACDDRFWQFTFDEMAEFDLPATINYILQTTGASELGYVGHSQGTTIAFARFSEDKELAAKVSVAVMLAPVAYVRHVTSGLLLAMASLRTPELIKVVGAREFLPNSDLLSQVEGGPCGINPGVCNNVVGALFGFNPTNINQSRWDVYLNYAPAGTSTRNIVHWSQNVRLTEEPVLQKFDFGDRCETLFLNQQRTCNWNVYGQDAPPRYDISQFNVSVALFMGGKDKLCDVADQDLLVGVLPPKRIVHNQFNPEYEHMDYTWGMDANQKVYAKVVELFSQP